MPQGPAGVGEGGKGLQGAQEAEAGEEEGAEVELVEGGEEDGGCGEEAEVGDRHCVGGLGGGFAGLDVRAWWGVEGKRREGVGWTWACGRVRQGCCCAAGWPRVGLLTGVGWVLRRGSEEQ